MSALSEQEDLWIKALAGRLRLIQADAATTTPNQRREFLNEEIARSFRSIAAEDRKRLLEALLAHFPVAAQVLQGETRAPAPPAPRAESFEQLLERLLQKAGELSAEQRLATARRLDQAGLTVLELEAATLELPEDLRRGLGVPQGRSVQLRNLVVLCALLISRFHGLDKSALEALRRLSPKSFVLKRPQDFSGAAAQFLGGELASVEPQVLMTVDLVTALLKAAVEGCEGFCRQHIVERFSPAAIEDVVIAESGRRLFPGFGKSRKVKCWEKYQLLAKELAQAEVLQRQLRDCAGVFVERYMAKQTERRSLAAEYKYARPLV